jgi:hypothetical protein
VEAVNPTNGEGGQPVDPPVDGGKEEDLVSAEDVIAAFELLRDELRWLRNETANNTLLMKDLQTRSIWLDDKLNELTRRSNRQLRGTTRALGGPVTLTPVEQS